MKIKVGEKILISKTKHGTLVYGTVIWIHPQKRFLLTERTTALGKIIRECAEEHEQLAAWLEELSKFQWIPVTKRLPENAAHPGAFCPRYMVMTKYGVTEGWYNPDKESWFILFWFMTERLLEQEISFERGDIPRVVKVPLHMGIVTAWMPMPEPCTPAEEGCK